MTVNLKGGPVIALVLALADEMIDIVQATHDTLLEEQSDIKGASEASAKLERLCMLRSLVEMQIGEHDDKPEQLTNLEKIVSYLQENDPGVFPINLREIEDGKRMLLESYAGVCTETANWFDAEYSGLIILDKPVRWMKNKAPTPTIAQCACQSMDECDGADNCQLAAAEEAAKQTPAFPATKQPGFRPDIPPRPVRAPDMPPAPEHKREIYPGMPMSGGDQQGMPGGRLGDR